MTPEDEPRIVLQGNDPDGALFEREAPPDASVIDAEREIRAQGGRLNLARVTEPDRARPRGVSAEDFARFNELLATSVRRGLPLLAGVRDVARSMRRSRFRASLDRVEAHLRRGDGLRQAFDTEGAGFPRLYGHLLEAGAAGGDLPGVLLALGRNIRTDALFRRGVVEALVYPAFLFVMCVLFLTGFGVSFMPGVKSTAEALAMRIPVLTRIAAGDVAAARVAGSVLIGGATLALLAWYLGLRHTRTGRRLAEAVARRVPVYRDLHEAALWSAACETLALLLDAGVPMPQALRLAGPATGTKWLTGAFSRMADGVEAGMSVADAARRAGDVPFRFIRAVDSGETRGDPAGALKGLAADYRRAAENQADLFVRYLPPALALAFGVLVFAMAWVVLGPYIRFWGAAWAN